MNDKEELKYIDDKSSTDTQLDTLLPQNGHRCTEIISTTKKRCTKEALTHGKCISHTPRELRNEIAHRYKENMAPTLKTTFEAIADDPDPHDLKHELTLIRAMLSENILPMLSAAMEKEDNSAIMACNMLIRNVLKDIASLADTSQRLRERTQRTIPVKMLGTVVQQLLNAVEVATNGDPKTMQKLSEELQKVRLPKIVMDMPND